VAATLSESLSRVVTSSRDGKIVNSMGDCMNMQVMRTTMEMLMLKVSSRSRRIVGMGTSITMRMMTTPTASMTSPCLANFA